VDTVIRNLKKAKYNVQARSDYANEVHEVEYPQGKQAYAKIAGNGWTYYVDDLEVHIGRPPDEKQTEPQTPGTSIPDKTIDIDLGPSKLISRDHARIKYEDSNGQWYLTVLGRNGLKVDDETLPRHGTLPLHSGSVIDVAGTQMMFVTPNDAPVIHPTIRDQVRAQQNGHDLQEDEEEEEEQEHVQPVSTRSQRTPTRLPPTRSSHHQSRVSASGSIDLGSSAHAYGKIAYGGYPSVTTPVVQNDGPGDPRIPSSQSRPKTSPSYSRGLVLETTDDIDYSVDTARDLKPPHSYAQLIGMAILSSPEEKLTLSKIYDWIKERYAFYRFSGGGWQNSIRHNLSLNKCFEKVARRTDEPGKGMKWQIVADHKEEFVKKGLSSARKPTLHGSPGPNSPMFNIPSSADHDRRQSTSYLRDAFPETRNGNTFMKTSPTSTPPRLPYPTQKQAYTPDRGGAIQSQNAILDASSPRIGPSQNYSPFHYGQGQSRLAGLTEAAAAATPGGLPVFGGSDSDSQLYTPHLSRHQPKLVPPSTARLPSHFMPLSSPAPFWKYAADFGSTPARFDNNLLFGSPLKTVRLKTEDNTHDNDLGKPQADSSSPPINATEVEVDSPTRPSSSRARDMAVLPHVPIEKMLPAQAPQEQQHQHTQPVSASQLQPAAEISEQQQPSSQSNKPMPPPSMNDEEEDGDEQGFDLSKYVLRQLHQFRSNTNVFPRGFQAIGSFHRNMTATVIRGN